MGHQTEGPHVKQLTIKIPWELYYQLKCDAEQHGQSVTVHARHILADALLGVKLTAEHYEAIRESVKEAEAKIAMRVSKRKRQGGAKKRKQ